MQIRRWPRGIVGGLQRWRWRIVGLCLVALVVGLMAACQERNIVDGQHRDRAVTDLADRLQADTNGLITIHTNKNDLSAYTWDSNGYIGVTVTVGMCKGVSASIASPPRPQNAANLGPMFLNDPLGGTSIAVSNNTFGTLATRLSGNEYFNTCVAGTPGFLKFAAAHRTTP